MHFPSLNAIIEGLLFVSDGPMTLDRLTELLPDYERASVRLAVQQLRDDYEQRGSGVHLVEVSGGWQLRTVPELMP